LFLLFASGDNKLDKKYSLDGLHLNGEAYLLWKKEIEKYLTE